MRLWILCTLLLAAPMHAGLMEHVGNASEAEVIANFEKALPQFLADRLPEKSLLPRIRIKSNRGITTLQLHGVEGSKSTWQELVPVVWFPERTDYVYAPHGPLREFNILQVEPDQVATWFHAKYRSPGEMVALAVWLASKSQLMVANAKLAELGQLRTDLRPAIDEWLCTKHGWESPAEGLTLVHTHDLDLKEDGALLLTADAQAARLKELEKEARDALSQIEELQGKDVKSKPGQRRRPPQMRLDLLLDKAQRWSKAYAGTKFVQHKRNTGKIEDVIEAIKADMAFLETARFQAERFGVDKDWENCAKAWEDLMKVDPFNDELIKSAALAWQHAAQLTDGGAKSEFPDRARRSAELYELLVKQFPRSVAWLNYAGSSWLPAGEKAKAKANFEDVLRRTAGRDDLDDNERQNREYAENMLKLCK